MSEDLQRLAARTRELVLDLDATRADVLSVADLNRALRQVLRNQVAIIDFLAGSRARLPDDARAAEARLPDDAQARRPEASRTTPRPGASQASARPGVEPLVFEPDELAVPALSGNNGPSNGAVRLEAGQGAEAPASTDDAPTAAPEGAAASVAEQILRELRVLPVHIARSVVEEFDNRDKSYDKGLDKLNRWVAGGTGTPFQWRGDRAYLNPNGAGPAAVKNYEEQLMSRMGFSRRLGRLVVPGLQGEVIIYERPG